MQLGGIEQFRGMTRERFLGNPKIIDAAPPELAPIDLRGAKPESFLGAKYTIAFSERGALVYDGEKIIASYWSGRQSVLFVDDAYRRQGIALELMYQRALRYGALVARSRTQVAQGIALKVWDRIQTELKAKPA